MYFWHVNRLSDLLKKDQIRQRQIWLYFVLSFVFFGKISLFMAYMMIYSLEEALLELVLGVLGALWGVHQCFLANESGDGRRFLDRFFCLSLPIMVRLFCVVLLIFLVEEIFLLFVLKQSILFESSVALFLFNVCLGVGLDLWFFLWMRAKLRYISGA